MKGSSIKTVIEHLEHCCEIKLRVANKPSTPERMKVLYQQKIEDFRRVIALLSGEPFKLTDEHEAQIKPFILGLVFDNNGQDHAIDFELPFAEIKGIFNQVVDNLNE